MSEKTMFLNNNQRLKLFVDVTKKLKLNLDQSGLTEDKQEEIKRKIEESKQKLEGKKRLFGTPVFIYKSSYEKDGQKKYVLYVQKNNRTKVEESERPFRVSKNLSSKQVNKLLTIQNNKAQLTNNEQQVLNSSSGKKIVSSRLNGTVVRTTNSSKNACELPNRLQFETPESGIINGQNWCFMNSAYHLLFSLFWDTDKVLLLKECCKDSKNLQELVTKLLTGQPIDNQLKTKVVDDMVELKKKMNKTSEPNKNIKEFSSGNQCASDEFIVKFFEIFTNTYNFIKNQFEYKTITYYYYTKKSNPLTYIPILNTSGKRSYKKMSGGGSIIIEYIPFLDSMNANIYYTNMSKGSNIYLTNFFLITDNGKKLDLTESIIKLNKILKIKNFEEKIGNKLVYQINDKIQKKNIYSKQIKTIETGIFTKTKKTYNPGDIYKKNIDIKIKSRTLKSIYNIVNFNITKNFDKYKEKFIKPVYDAVFQDFLNQQNSDVLYLDVMHVFTPLKVEMENYLNEIVNGWKNNTTRHIRIILNMKQPDSPSPSPSPSPSATVHPSITVPVVPSATVVPVVPSVPVAPSVPGVPSLVSKKTPGTVLPTTVQGGANFEINEQNILKFQAENILNIICKDEESNLNKLISDLSNYDISYNNDEHQTSKLNPKTKNQSISNFLGTNKNINTFNKSQKKRTANFGVIANKNYFINLGKFLIINLKPYYFSGTGTAKMFLNFKLNNNLNDVIKIEELVKQSDGKYQVKEKEYNFQDIILKSGEIKSGHYICLSKRNNTWYLYNDDRISQNISNDYLKNINQNSFKPIIILLKQVNP